MARPPDREPEERTSDAGAMPIGTGADAGMGNDTGFSGDLGNLGPGSGGDGGTLRPAPGVDGGGPMPKPGNDAGAPTPIYTIDRGPLAGYTIPEAAALLGWIPGDRGQFLIPLGPDVGQPSYLTVEPDGQVGADFSGRVRAKGLTVDAQEGGGFPPNPDPEREIDFVRASDEKLISRLYGNDVGSGTKSELQLHAVKPDGSTAGTVMALRASIGAGANEVIELLTGALSRLLIDKDGRSHFLQVRGGAVKSEMNFGVATVPNTAAPSVAFNIPHLLGRVPRVGIVAGGGGSHFLGVSCNDGAHTASSLSVSVITWTGANIGANERVNWIAIA